MLKAQSLMVYSTTRDQNISHHIVMLTGQYHLVIEDQQLASVFSWVKLDYMVCKEVSNGSKKFYISRIHGTSLHCSRHDLALSSIQRSSSTYPSHSNSMDRQLKCNVTCYKLCFHARTKHIEVDYHYI